MTTKRKYKSDAFRQRSTASAMYRAGTIDKATMRSFDESCLAVPEQIGPAQIKRIRQSQRVSQPVFARYLNTSESTVEVGDRRKEAERNGVEAIEHRAKAWTKMLASFAELTTRYVLAPTHPLRQPLRSAPAS